jgi:hypothetical protein
MEAYLVSEPVVRHAGTTPSAVHEAMLHLIHARKTWHEPILAASSAPEDVSSVFPPHMRVAAPPTSPTFACELCKCDKYVVDVAGGHRMCSECGAVSSTVKLHQPTASLALSGARKRKSDQGSNQAPHSTCSSDQAARSAIRRAAEHWNVYTHLGADELHFAVALAVHVNQRVSEAAKVVAALLYVKNLSNICDWLKGADHLTIVALPPRMDAFQCRRCEARLSSRFQLRHHRCARQR